MATIAFTQLRIHGAVIVTWADLSNDDEGAPYEPPVGYRLQTMQFTGTLGTGPSLDTEGSNEETPSNYGSLASATTLGASIPIDASRHYRPAVAGGSGSTITAIGFFSLLPKIPGAADVVSFFAFGDDGNGIIKTLVTGDGPVTFQRAGDDATIDDHEGLIVACLENEIRHRKGRRGENLEPNSSEDLSSSDWITFGTATTSDNGDGTHTWNLPNTNDRIENQNLVSDPESRSFVFTIYATGSGTIRLRIVSNAVRTVAQEQITLTSETQRFSIQANFVDTDTGSLDVGARKLGDDTATSMVVQKFQLEEVTGQANQNPSEYVSVGVGTGSEEIAEVTAWTIGPGWADDGVDSLSAVAATSNTYKDLGLVQNKTYIVSLTVSNRSAGSFRIQLGGTFGGIIDADGDYTQVIVCGSSNTQLLFNGWIAFTGDITNISIKAADHGAFVDGVRYYAKTNPCQVDGNNVVTEDAATTPITDYYTWFEQASTNRISEPLDFTTGGGDWTISSAAARTVSTAVQSPVKGETWWRLESNSNGTSPSRHIYSNTYTKDNEVETWVGSFEIEQDELTWAELRVEDGTGAAYARQFFNLATGATGTSTTNLWTYEDAGYEQLKGDAIRIWMKVTTTAGTSIRLKLTLAEDDGDTNINLQTGEGFYIQGAQLEESPTVTTLIKTGATTRPADDPVPLFPRTGNIDVEEGTFTARFFPGIDAADFASTIGLFLLRDDSSASLCYYGPTDARITTFDGTASRNQSLAGHSAGDEIRIGIYWSKKQSQYGLAVHDGSWSAWSEGAFDGEYETVGDQMVVGLNLVSPIGFRDVKIYSSALDTDKIEDEA